MTLFLRLFMVVFAAMRAKTRLELDGVSRVRLRLSGRDLEDEAVKKTRWSAFADLGILDYLTRTGVLSIARKHGWLPILAGREIEIHAPGLPGRRVELETRLDGWDERYTFFTHRFLVDGVHAATVRSIGRLASPKEKTPLVNRILEGLGLPADMLTGVPEDFAPAMARLKAARARRKAEREAQGAAAPAVSEEEVVG